ncbi:MAG: hypothetical protein KGD64_07190 [Candidatus Heimdallarchaeota archaeon]|nr:hypothetical protein [Candidatus Heimdallarchaeota archaeon]
MHTENLIEDMNKILGKMDKELNGLNRELDKILKQYPRYIEDDEAKLKYAYRKYNHGK